MNTIHMIRNSLKYVSYKERKELAQNLKAIYSAATADEAKDNLEAFGKKWDHRYPTVSRESE